MSERFNQYAALLMESLSAQRRGDVAREDQLLARLDFIWLNMSPGERARTDALNKLLAKPGSGICHIDHYSMSQAGAGDGIVFVGESTQPYKAPPRAEALKRRTVFSWLGEPAIEIATWERHSTSQSPFAITAA